MAKGKFLGFLGKVGGLVGNVIPAAGVAGKLATNASNLIKAKLKPSEKQKEQNNKQTERETKVAAAVLGGTSEGWAKFSVAMGEIWDFVVKYWWAFLPAIGTLIWLVFFKKKRRRVTRRRAVASRPVARRRAAPSRSNFAARMLKARRAKARRSKR
jgi:hypothetical protein